MEITREERKRREKEKNKSLYEILDRLKKMDNKISNIREEKLNKLKTQKAKVRDYSLQVRERPSNLR